MTRHRVGRAEATPPGHLRQVMAGGELICLAPCEEDGQFYAINDTCTHENFSLSLGELQDLDVECPQHGSRFNLQTGKVTGLPAVIPALTYKVSVEDGEVFIEVPE